MNQPKRIQRKRTKGWKMPENTVYVGRPSRWGNPYRVREEWTPDKCVNAYRKHCEVDSDIIVMIKRDLKGKDLACWCKEGEPCHADVLLEIANS